MSSGKKLLLMGRSGSGKSSMRSIIFSNYSAFDTRRLGATIDVEHSNLRFLNNMTLNLWDCGGQDAFMETFLNSADGGEDRGNNIFKKAEVLIHVFDVESKQVSKDIDTFRRVLANLQRHSSDCRVFILIHKMDLVQVNKRQELFDMMFGKLQAIAQNDYGFNITGFGTSIWDESLYKAWSSIVCSLIPNVSVYENHLEKLNEVLNAREIILFEKTTFLVISSMRAGDNADGKGTVTATAGSDLDPKRFEKISNIIKTYKQSVGKIRSSFQKLVLHGTSSSIYLDVLTSNIYIMIITEKRPTPYDVDNENLIVEDIKLARHLFERIENKRL